MGQRGSEKVRKGIEKGDGAEEELDENNMG
jgi:hypothetical protein